MYWYCPALEFYHYMKLPELRVRSVDPWIVDFRKNVKYTENQFLIRFFGGVGFSWIFLERGFISRGKTKINGKKVHSKIPWIYRTDPKFRELHVMIKSQCWAIPECFFFFKFSPLSKCSHSSLYMSEKEGGDEDFIVLITAV